MDPNSLLCWHSRSSCQRKKRGEFPQNSASHCKPLLCPSHNSRKGVSLTSWSPHLGGTKGSMSVVGESPSSSMTPLTKPSLVTIIVASGSGCTQRGDFHQTTKDQTSLILDLNLLNVQTGPSILNCPCASQAPMRLH